MNEVRVLVASLLSHDGILTAEKGHPARSVAVGPGHQVRRPDPHRRARVRAAGRRVLRVPQRHLRRADAALSQRGRMARAPAGPGGSASGRAPGARDHCRPHPAPTYSHVIADRAGVRPAARRLTDPTSGACLGRAVRRPGDLRHHRRPGQEDDAALAVPARGTRPAGHPDHRRRTQQLERRGPARPPRPVPGRAGRRRRPGGGRAGSGPVCATCAATRRPTPPYAALAAGARRERAPAVLPGDPAVDVRDGDLGLHDVGLLREGRVAFEKPFGDDFASARALNERLHAVLDESRIFRIDHFLRKQAVEGILYLRFANRSSSRCGTAGTSRACRSRWPSRSTWGPAARSTTTSAPCATWSPTTCCRS